MLADRRLVWRAGAGVRGSVAADRSEPLQSTARHPCRILVVDDDVIIRAHLCALLHASDYDVETAASGEEALHRLRSYPCDIVITDWQMPLMDGVAMCRHLRTMEFNKHVYLVMLTVKGSQQELLAGFAAGADDYVVKGTPSEELLARLERGRTLARRRATHRSTAGDVARLSLMDSRTGTYNLAFLMRHLPREMARSERYGRSLVVLGCEIELHGSVNERLVDTVRDELVRRFACSATACIRRSDWLARSSASKFVIVLPETDENGARSVMRKLSEAFARPELHAKEEPPQGGIQFDVTVMDPANGGAGAACLRALLRESEARQHHDGNDDIRLPEPGTAYFLRDFESSGDVGKGRNWPAT